MRIELMLDNLAICRFVVVETLLPEIVENICGKNETLR
jgi:hypothetical protein